MLNVIHKALVPRQKMLLPPLDIKLGLLKQFVKALDSNFAVLHHIREMFPRLADAKVIGRIFTGPQVRVMLAFWGLEQTMTVVERMLGRPSEWWRHIFLVRISTKIIKKWWNI
jgi:hypothetical protein